MKTKKTQLVWTYMRRNVYLLGNAIMEEVDRHTGRIKPAGRFLVQAELRDALVYARNHGDGDGERRIVTYRKYRPSSRPDFPVSVDDGCISIGCHRFRRDQSAKLLRWVELDIL